MKEQVTVTVDVVGNITNKRYEGIFVCKVKQTQRDVLRQDELYRRALGINAAEASLHASAVASALAFLSTRIIEAPNWWTQSDNGFLLEDDNVLVAVHKAVSDAITAEYKELADKAEKARQELRKEAEKPL